MARVTVQVHCTSNVTRFWLKAIREDGSRLFIENIHQSQIIKARNELVEQLSEEYDEVVGEAIPNLKLHQVWKRKPRP